MLKESNKLLGTQPLLKADGTLSLQQIIRLSYCVERCLLGLLCLTLSLCVSLTVPFTLKSTAILTEILYPFLISLFRPS